MPENWQRAGFGLYVHWPYCTAKCPYCDFNSHVSATIDQTPWRRAYTSEIARIAAETPGRILTSIFFGGGTPSLMDPDLVGAVITAAGQGWSFANDIEITLEANPTSVEAAKFRDFGAAGVNRVSVGVQALNDADLKALGRLHNVDEALAAVELAQTSFERVSFDLIYARQNQTLTEWRAELTRALAFSAGHLSLYQLTIEDDTPFGDRLARGGLLGLPDEDRAADMFALTQELCDGAGLPAYEISNHALPGDASRHNLIYWRGGDYAGVGPGAHGRLTLADQRIATTTPLAPIRWLRAVETEGSGEMPREVQTESDIFNERLMMGLRLSEGVELGSSPHINFNKINGLSEIGVIDWSGRTLRLTESGRPVLNAVLRELIATP